MVWDCQSFNDLRVWPLCLVLFSRNLVLDQNHCIREATLLSTWEHLLKRARHYGCLAFPRYHIPHWIISTHHLKKLFLFSYLRRKGGKACFPIHTHLPGPKAGVGNLEIQFRSPTWMARTQLTMAITSVCSSRMLSWSQELLPRMKPRHPHVTWASQPGECPHSSSLSATPKSSMMKKS